MGGARNPGGEEGEPRPRARQPSADRVVVSLGRLVEDHHRQVQQRGEQERDQAALREMLGIEVELVGREDVFGEARALRIRFRGRGLGDYAGFRGGAGRLFLSALRMGLAGGRELPRKGDHRGGERRSSVRAAGLLAALARTAATPVVLCPTAGDLVGVPATDPAAARGVGIGIGVGLAGRSAEGEGLTAIAAAGSADREQIARQAHGPAEGGVVLFAQNPVLRKAPVALLVVDGHLAVAADVAGAAAEEDRAAVDRNRASDTARADTGEPGQLLEKIAVEVIDRCSAVIAAAGQPRGADDDRPVVDVDRGPERLPVLVSLEPLNGDPLAVNQRVYVGGATGHGVVAGAALAGRPDQDHIGEVVDRHARAELPTGSGLSRRELLEEKPAAVLLLLEDVDESRVDENGIAGRVASRGPDDKPAVAERDRGAEVVAEGIGLDDVAQLPGSPIGVEDDHRSRRGVAVAGCADRNRRSVDRNGGTEAGRRGVPVGVAESRLLARASVVADHEHRGAAGGAGAGIADDDGVPGDRDGGAVSIVIPGDGTRDELDRRRRGRSARRRGLRDRVGVGR